MAHLLVLLLLCLRGMALDLQCDPWASIDRQANETLLQQLSAAWDTSMPSDAERRTAAMALVNLALNGDVRLCPGDEGGVYIARAAELLAMSPAVAEPRTFNDQIPHLWLAAYSARSAEVVAALDKAGAAADSPQGRSLRCFSTLDHRALRAVISPNPLEALILLRSALEQAGSNPTGYNWLLLSDFAPAERARLFSLIPPMSAAVLSHSLWRTADATPEMLRSTLRAALLDTLRLLTHPAADQAARQACIAGWLASVDGAHDDAERIARLVADTAGADLARPGPQIAAALRFLETCLTPPRSLRSGDGRWHLDNLGDRASTTRRMLIKGVRFHHLPVKRKPAIYKATYGSLLEGTDLCAAMLAAQANDYDDEEADRRLETAVRGEAARGLDGFGITHTADIVDDYMTSGRFKDRSQRLMVDLLAAYAQQRPRAGLGWSRLCMILPRTPDAEQWNPVLAVIAEHDSWNPCLALQLPGSKSWPELRQRFPWSVAVLRAAVKASLDERNWPEILASTEGWDPASSYVGVGFAVARAQALLARRRNEEAVTLLDALLASPLAREEHQVAARQLLARASAQIAERAAHPPPQWNDARDAESMADYMHRQYLAGYVDEATALAQRLANGAGKEQPGYRLAPLQIPLWDLQASSAATATTLAKYRSQAGNLRFATGSRLGWRIVQGLRGRGLYEDVLAGATADLASSSPMMAVLRAQALLETGRTEAALECLEICGRQARPASDDYGPMRCMQFALARLLGADSRVPRDTAMIDSSSGEFLPGQRIVMRLLQGKITPEDLETELESADNAGREMRYLIALLAMSNYKGLDLGDQVRAARERPDTHPDAVGLDRLMALRRRTAKPLPA
ncbi:MAG TPA: hypothetical protein DCS97_12535, partial [Planctomycetes bacterium]|nr:hypothetical protein [Planctomycetota bacterium]